MKILNDYTVVKPKKDDKKQKVAEPIKYNETVSTKAIKTGDQPKQTTKPMFSKSKFWRGKELKIC